MALNLGPFERLLLHRWLKRHKYPEPQEPEDFDSAVRVPLKKGPGSRSAAVAMEEPSEPKQTKLFGRPR